MCQLDKGYGHPYQLEGTVTQLDRFYSHLYHQVLLSQMFRRCKFPLDKALEVAGAQCSSDRASRPHRLSCLHFALGCKYLQHKDSRGNFQFVRHNSSLEGSRILWLILLGRSVQLCSLGSQSLKLNL
jgi:hypothetical protein